MQPAPTTSFHERLLQAVLESVTDRAIIGLDPDGLVTAWNERARRILGWTEDEMVGAEVSVIFTDHDRAHGVPQAERQASLDGGRSTAERWHQRKDGSRFWSDGEMRAWRGEAGGPAGFVKILHDRTEPPPVAERVGQVTGRLAHDFNNLLTGIVGSLELMQTRLGQGRAAELGCYIEAAQDAATRAAALIERLLVLSQQHTPQPVASAEEEATPAWPPTRE